MRRCVLVCLALSVVSACQGDDATRPKPDPTSSPSPLISDGNHRLGNPDFFFLPPFVPDPRRTAQWNAGAANPNLTPTVAICELTATREIDITATSPCKPGGYTFSQTLGRRNVSNGILDDIDIDALRNFVSHYTSFGESYYHLGWKVPAGAPGTTKPPTFYRIVVSVGATRLGIADVESVNNFTQLRNVQTNDFVPLTGGVTVPINFRIERYALCSTPGVGPCTTGSGNISLAPLTVETGGATSTGVTIPQQTGLPSTPVTVTIQSCPDLHGVVTDLPTFGACVRVTTDPVLPLLTIPATVFVCEVSLTAIEAGRLASEEQERRVTLHRYDATGPNAGLAALPHAGACTSGLPGGHASTTATVRGMLASLIRGHVTAAARQAAELLAPKPLYAATFIDLGGGGLTRRFSDFQFALPAKMEIVPGTNNQSAPAGTVLHPTVRVTDLGGEAVTGALVHFFSNDPATTPGTAVISGEGGTASTAWTIVQGTNTLPVSGRGIAGPNRNGPRRTPGSEADDIVDPFQPIQSAFDGSGATPSGEVAVGTGIVSFSATAVAGEIVVFNDVNVFDDEALGDANNQRLVRNLVSFTGSGPRASGTVVLMNSGHTSAYANCFAQAAQNEIAGQGYTFSANTLTPLGALAANVKVLILCLPTTDYSADEITSMKQFATEGGRIVFVGEHGGFYGPSIGVQNSFLANMSAGMRVTGDLVDCGRQTIPVPAEATHPIMSGLTQVTMGCSSAITTLATGDVALYYDRSGTKVLSGVAKLGAPVGIAAARVQSASATFVPSDDPLGRSVGP